MLYLMLHRITAQALWPVLRVDCDAVSARQMAVSNKQVAKCPANPCHALPVCDQTTERGQPVLPDAWCAVVTLSSSLCSTHIPSLPHSLPLRSAPVTHQGFGFLGLGLKP